MIASFSATCRSNSPVRRSSAAIEDRQAVAGEEQHLHRIAATVEKQKQSARLDLPAEFLLHDSHQTRKVLAHIRRLCVGVHARRRQQQAQHDAPPSG
ncbi:MAG: hypothetical protein WD875_12460 [Pirellulales bacterium]